MYNPQFFKENLPMVSLVGLKLQDASINQYKIEERSIVAKRILSSGSRINQLVNCMINDTISTNKNIDLLKFQVYEFTKDIAFKKSKNMGEVLAAALDFVKRNYENMRVSW